MKNLSEHFSIEIQHDPINTYLKNLKIKFEVNFYFNIFINFYTFSIFPQAPYPLDAIFD